MSKIISLAATQSATNVQVKQQAAKLEFKVNVPDAAAATWTLLMAALNAITLNVELQSKSGRTENLLPKMPLGKVAEAYSCNEGSIVVTDDGADKAVVFSVELGAIGALAMDADTSIVIDTNALAANTAMDVYAVDFPYQSPEAVKTNVIKFNANAPQAVSLNKASFIHLPKASFDKIELSYPGGKVVTLVAKEVEGWCIEGNGTQGVLEGVTTLGFIDLYSLNVADALSAKVTMTADVNGYLFTSVAV